MRLAGFPRTAVNITLKDWREYHKPIVAMAVATILASSITLIFAPQSVDFIRGALLGVALGGAYGFAQSCFFNERQRGTLPLLPGLPITPQQLVWAKFISAFSMTLVVVNAPAFLLRDLRFQLFSNASALLLTAVCMAATVLSDNAWAPQLPLWIVMIVAIPASRLVPRYAPHLLDQLFQLRSHQAAAALSIVAFIPVIVLVSARIFHNRIR